ncbi:MAG: phosphate ABC transporter permease subunit PstC [Candidatus Methanoplasma sp.]|jgi:phosphate transport system permease protein|nr:phosphate ABC transporter permease subunit PstC [Candidatus Methanoplasma sp.]
MTPEDTVSVSGDIPKNADISGIDVCSHPKRFISRIRIEDRAKLILMAAVVFTVAVLFFIIIFISYNSLDAVKEIGIWEFLTGGTWSPGSGAYGASSLIVGTFLVTGGSILFALPVGLGMAIYINDVASPRVRNILKPACELFAGIPSVVYGFIGLAVMVPFLMDVFPAHLNYGTSWLAGSLLLGIMALPIIISVSQDSLEAVPGSYREASMALGATKWETTRKVVLRSAVSGIAAAVILGIGRALGETMAVMMVTGNSALIPEPLWNIFDMVRTLTASIALEMPEAVHGSLHFSALFMLALILMVIVLLVNTVARRMVRRTKIKMGTEKAADVRRRRLFAPLSESHKEMAKTAAVYALVFAPAFMISSLFIGTYGGIAIGALAAAGLPVSKRISRAIGPNRVQSTVYLMLGITVAAVLAVLAVFLGVIAVNGLPAISPEFIFSPPSNSGLSGGIWPAVIGTIELAAGTALISFPLGVCSGIYLSQYAGDTRLIRLARQAIDSLNGTPSIIFGLFGMSLLVIAFGWGYSLVGGCITLSLMVLPTIIKTTEEAVSAVPKDLTEASAAMGASKWHTVSKVLLPASMGGVITGFILSIGRAIGETAPIMFTAAVAFRTTSSFSLLDPIMALPYHLYYLASEVPGSTANQYGTALVLMMIVIVLFAAASVIRYRYRKKTGW